MPPQSFLWYFSLNQISLSENDFFSNYYILSKTDITVSPEILINSRVWLIMEDDGFFVYGLLHVQTIERILEGVNEGDYLLTTNSLASFKLFKSRGSRDLWDAGAILDVKQSTFTPCGRETDSLLIDLLANRSPKNIMPIKAIIYSDIPNTKAKDLNIAIQDQLTKVLQFGCLNDLPQFIGLKGVSGFGAAVYEKIRQLNPEIDEELLLNKILLLDPLKLNKVKNRKYKDTDHLNFDPNFVPIIPDNITSRALVASSSVYSKDWLSKTEEAESAHQNIVRDFSTYLIGQGFDVLQSRSVDLLVRSDSSLILFEVKSATGENFKNQCEKGIIQILRYEIELIRYGLKPDFVAIMITDVSQPTISDYLIQLGQRVGVFVFFYKSSLNWPDRGGGFHKYPPFSEQ